MASEEHREKTQDSKKFSTYWTFFSHRPTKLSHRCNSCKPKSWLFAVHSILWGRWFKMSILNTSSSLRRWFLKRRSNLEIQNGLKVSLYTIVSKDIKREYSCDLMYEKWLNFKPYPPRLQFPGAFYRMDHASRVFS